MEDNYIIPQFNQRNVSITSVQMKERIKKAHEITM